MGPPSNQKHLIQVEKSKTKTIKFKNGFPPKVIRSRSSFGEVLKPNHSIDLVCFFANFKIHNLWLLLTFALTI